MTAGFEAKTRQAAASSILVCFQHIMHINVDNAIIYYRVSQGDDIATNDIFFLHNTAMCVPK